MAGITDFLNSPQGMGLLSGIASYAANARRGQPVNSVGRGLAGGLLGYQYAQNQLQQDAENAIANQYKQMQIDEIKRKQNEQQALREAAKQAAGSAYKTDTVYMPEGNTSPIMPSLSGAPDMVGDYSMMDGANPVEFSNVAQQRKGQFDQTLYQGEMFKQLADRGLHDEAMKYATKAPEYKTVGDSLVAIGSTGVKPVYTANPKDKRPWYVSQDAQGRTVYDPEYLANEEKLGSARAPKNTVTVGGTTVINDAAREKLGGKIGTDIGEQAAAIEGKWSALDSVREAKEMLSKGIYSGKWSNIKMGFAKGTSGALGDRQKAANTEAYVSFIGNTVIPRLKEFGGNDSVEEMKYLQQVMGGNIELEPEALDSILNSVEVKIQRGIERLQRQQDTIEKGGVPDLGAGPSRTQPPQAAVNMLKMNPKLRNDFDAKYGAGSAARILGN